MNYILTKFNKDKLANEFKDFFKHDFNLMISDTAGQYANIVIDHANVSFYSGGMGIKIYCYEYNFDATPELLVPFRSKIFVKDGLIKIKNPKGGILVYQVFNPFLIESDFPIDDTTMGTIKENVISYMVDKNLRIFREEE